MAVKNLVKKLMQFMHSLETDPSGGVEEGRGG